MVEMKEFCYIGNEWDNVLKKEFSADYFDKLMSCVDAEYKATTVYPPRRDIFRALKEVDYPAVKVCILGQDPYHGEGQANGMAFAVSSGRFPPSLMNIFAELKNDVGAAPTADGTLLGWAKQGVLLLNTVLTVRAGQPQSHSGFGWQRFTDAVIRALSEREKPLVFILWGSSAAEKRNLISPSHCILTSPHPSPLSAHRGFFGSRPFSKANEFLVSAGQTPVDWCADGNRAEYYLTSGNIHKI